MQRRSKFRLSKRSSQKSRANYRSDVPDNNIPLLLRLAPRTQSYVKCRIGEHIYAGTNWVFIKKAAIMESLEFSDDFACVLDAIRNYPEREMLIGSYGFDQDAPEEFQLCPTVICKNNIITQLETRQKRINQMFNMPIYAWTSLGSEVEVHGMQNYNLRSLLVVEIDSIFPIFIGKRIFSIRESNDYAECCTKRYEYKNTWRSRVDAAIQASAELKDAYVQTRTASDLRNMTQYETVIEVKTPKPEVAKRLLNFLDSHLYFVENILQFNYHIHLHSNDYFKLQSKYLIHVDNNFKEILACQDIKKCQRKQVSCVSWNPFIKGLFVASYVHRGFDHVHFSEPSYKDTETFGDNVALVWSFNDMQRPKLYLTCSREITNISFCPYNENIIVGGCSNGQIVIWDIRGQISKVEKKEILTLRERENHMHISNLILWMKKLPSSGYVRAAVHSSVQHGHKSAITSIKWLPPEYYISSTGQFSKCLLGDVHMQFLTTSLEDNNICVWDLEHGQKVRTENKRKPLQRLTRIPSALHKDDSPLMKKHQLFIPFFVLIAKDILHPKPVHIRSMLFKQFSCTYEKYRASTVANNFTRDYYKLMPTERTVDTEQAFVLSTVSGKLYDCLWDGFSYDHGNKINFDHCKLRSYAPIHDAPIVMCVVHRDDPNVFLSIGGKVFAVWQQGHATPILWRKYKSKYIFGKWSQVHPFEILLFTNDGFMHIWNFSVNSKFPTYTVRCHGIPSIGIYSNVGVEHYLKNSVLLMDRFGAIRIHQADSPVTGKNIRYSGTEESIKSYLENKRQVENCVAFWCKRFKESKVENDDCKPDQKEKKESIIKFKKSSEIKKPEVQTKSRQEVFEKKRHAYMYEQLTEYKNIHINELEANRQILNNIIQQNNELGKKGAQALSNKGELFERKKRNITWVPKKTQRKIFKISLPQETAYTLKKQYYEEYLLMEKEYSVWLKEYKCATDWRKMRQSKIYRTKMKKGYSPHENQAFKYDFRATYVFKTFDMLDDSI